MITVKKKKREKVCRQCLSLGPCFRYHSGRAGQAMVEFAVIAGMMLAMLAVLTLFLGTFREYGTRVLNLVGSEYP